MSDRSISNKQPRIKFLDSIPNAHSSKLGDMIVTNESGQTYLGIKGLDEWKVVPLSSMGLEKNLKLNSIDIQSESYIRGTLNLRADIKTARDIYLRNSKIYFDMTENPPNDYITGGGNDLKFYTSGTKRLDIGVTSSTFSNALIASSTLEVSDDIKLASTKKLYFDGGQDTYIASSSDNELNFYAGSGLGATNVLNLSSTFIKSDKPVFIKEQANASTDIDGYGQVWVHNDDPNTLYFTNDAGNDIQVTSGAELHIKYIYETKVVNWVNSGTSQIYLPISGYILEQTGTSSRNEYVGMVAPYNGTVEKFMFRCEEAQDGTLEFDILEASDGTENPGTTIGVKDTTIDIADDTSVEVTFSSMTSGTNALVKGRIYAFRVDTPAAPNDSNGTLVFKWDITS